MSKNRMNKIVREHFKRITKFPRKIVKHFDEETIHDFRVEYKKMRAFLRMNAPSTGLDRQLIYAHRLKKWYQTTGSLRDLQLQQRSVIKLTTASHDAPEMYLAGLKVAIKKIEKKLKRLARFATLGKDEIKIRNKPLLDPFVKHNCGVINAIINEQHYSDAQVHQIRKSLKDIFYTIRGLADPMDEISLSSGVSLKKEMDYFDSLLDELGEYQNKSVSLHFYEPEWISQLDTRELQAVNGLRGAVTKEKLAIRQVLLIHFEQEFPAHLDLLCNSNFDELIVPGNRNST